MQRFLFGFLFLLILSNPTPAFAWKFAVAGDTRPGSAYDHAQNVAGIISKIPNSDRLTVINSGDLTLDGTTSQLNTFKNIVSPFAINWNQSSPLSYIAVVGNHDTRTAGWQTSWAANFPAQTNLSAYPEISGEAQGLYGSTIINNAIFIWLNSISPTSAQETFLKNTLERSQTDTRIKWRFVSFHYPPLACYSSKSDWNLGKTWNDTYFVSNHVDALFLGDSHVYVRTCPLTSAANKICDPNNLNNSIQNPNGVIHLTVGGGGAESYPPDPARCSPFYQQGSGKHHFMTVDIQDNVLTANVYDTDTNIGTTNPPTAAQLANLPLIDSFTITKNNPTTPPSPTPAPLSGDFDSDGDIDFADFRFLLTHFTDIFSFNSLFKLTFK